MARIVFVRVMRVDLDEAELETVMNALDRDSANRAMDAPDLAGKLATEIREAMDAEYRQ